MTVIRLIMMTMMMMMIRPIW